MISISTRLIISIILILPSCMLSQTLFNRVGLFCGRIRNLQTYYNYEWERYSYYPEVKIGGFVVDKMLEWEFAWGYWDDRVKNYESIRASDGQSYKYTGHLFAFRTNLLLQEALKGWLFPMHLITGLSYHLIDRDYLGGSDLGGDIGRDRKINQLAFELGGGLYYDFFYSIRLRGEVTYMFNIDTVEYLYDDGEGTVFKIGMDYIID